jgi:hypothetical protein
MKRALVVVVSFLAGAVVAAQAPPPAPAAAAPAAAPAPAAVGAKTWLGREAEFEESLRTAPIERTTALPVGVTKSSRAFFAPGGPAASATVKHLPMGRRGGFWEAYKSEIAAYELDRLLGLDMVPPTVERRVGTDLASVQLHILVDGEWNMVLIDHSRAFASDRMPFEKEMTRIDRAFFERLKALYEPSVMKHVRPWLLGDGAARDILERRDKIVTHFEKEARKRGEAAVFPF